MNQNISPYELLKASKPRKPNTVTTPYDLYSAAQISATEPPEIISEQASSNAGQRAAVSVPSVPTRKTHYISDIQKRHNAALRRSALSPR